MTTPRRRLLLRSCALAASLAAPAVWRGTPARAQGRLSATPGQTEGPFYPIALPADHDADLLRNGSATPARGTPAWLEGRVSDLDGRPLSGAVIEIWQCDAAGRYHHPGDGDRADASFQGFGRVQIGTDGRYRFRTLRPASYPGRTPHIHVKLKLGPRELLTTQLYVAGDPGNARDFLWRGLGPAGQAALTVPFVAENGELRAQFPIAVAA